MNHDCPHGKHMGNYCDECEEMRLDALRALHLLISRKNYTFPAGSFAPANTWRWHCVSCKREPIGPMGGIGWLNSREEARMDLRRHNRRMHSREMEYGV